MFLRATHRYKDGKDHHYYSIVENRRLRTGRSIQKTLLYLGEINTGQKAAWIRAIEVVEGREQRQMTLFASTAPVSDEKILSVQLRMSALQLRHPRQWGACWLAGVLWEKLGRDGLDTGLANPGQLSLD